MAVPQLLFWQMDICVLNKGTIVLMNVCSVLLSVPSSVVGSFCSSVCVFVNTLGNILPRGTIFPG